MLSHLSVLTVYLPASHDVQDLYAKFSVPGWSTASLIYIVFDGLQESLVTEPVARLLEVLFYSTLRSISQSLRQSNV